VKNKEHLNESSTVARLLQLIQLSNLAKKKLWGKEATVLNFYRNSLTERERERERESQVGKRQSPRVIRFYVQTAVSYNVTYSLTLSATHSSRFHVRTFTPFITRILTRSHGRSLSQWPVSAVFLEGRTLTVECIQSVLISGSR